MRGSFNNKTLGQRLAVIAAGPIMNLVLATLLFALYMGLVVVPHRTGSGAPVTGCGGRSLPGDVITEVAGLKIQSIRRDQSNSCQPSE